MNVQPLLTPPKSAPDISVCTAAQAPDEFFIYYGLALAVAAIKVAQRNREWEHWQQTGQLPSWEELGAKASTAVE